MVHVNMPSFSISGIKVRLHESLTSPIVLTVSNQITLVRSYHVYSGQQFHYYPFSLLNFPLECGCDPEGSTSSTCDIITGQCPCVGNVTGQRCDECLPGFFGLGMPSGCVSCDCASPGSASEQCNEQGVCDCLPGVGGAKCDLCLTGFFGLSQSGCRGKLSYNFIYTGPVILFAHLFLSLFLFCGQL